MEVITRLSRSFEKVYVVVGYNPDKKYAITADERKQWVAEALDLRQLKNVFVSAYSGHIVDFAREAGAGTIVRGARSIDDLGNLELGYKYANEILDHGIITAIVVPYQYADISSSRFRKTLWKDGSIINEIPSSVKRYLTVPPYGAFWRYLKPNLQILKDNLGTKIIGLAGGIGSGKTTIVDMLEAEGAYCIKYDVIGIKVRDGEKKAEVIRVFGEEILDSAGKIDSKKLRGIVFFDRNKLQALNDLLVPAMNRLAYQEILIALERNYRLIVIEAAILFETGIQEILDCTWG